MFDRIKLWLKSTPLKDKILYTVSALSVTASIASIGACMHMKHVVDDIHVDVKLYPSGKDDPNPVDLTPEGEERPVVWTSPNDYITCVPSPKVEADTTSEKWEVWNPEWELKYPSKSGYESVRLADALEVLLRQDDNLLYEEDVQEAEARVEDLARQFAYLEGSEDDFRARFPQLKNSATYIYSNVEEKKGE